MGIDCYQVEVLHCLNPHLIWAEITDGAATEVIYEQLGLYGVLPLDWDIDTVKDIVTSRRSSEWMPAAAKLMLEALQDSKEVLFLPAYIDRRTSIFDDNIHKYGELVIRKSSGETIELSKVLLKAKIAVRDEVQFHQELCSGQLKTKLSKHKVKEVKRAMEQYYEQKERNQAVKWHTQNDYTENMELALTEENLQRHNQYPSTKYGHKTFQDAAILLKDIDEKPLGRGMSRKRKDGHTRPSDESEKSSDTRSELQRKLDVLKQSLANVPVVKKHPDKTSNENSPQNRIKSLDTTPSKFKTSLTVSNKMAKNIDDFSVTAMENIHAISDNLSNVSSPKSFVGSETTTPKLKKLLDMKLRTPIPYREPKPIEGENTNKEEFPSVKTTEPERVHSSGNSEGIKDHIDIEKSPEVQQAVNSTPLTPTACGPRSSRKRSKSGKTWLPPAYDPLTERRVAFGPPECNPMSLPLKVVPKITSAGDDGQEMNVKEDDVIPAPRKDDFDDTDSKVNIDINVEKHVEREKLPEIDVEDVEVWDVYDSINTPPDKEDVHAATKTKVGDKKMSLLLQKLRTMKNDSYSTDNLVSPDTSTKDTSSSDVESTKKVANESDEETICMSEIGKKLDAEYAAELTEVKEKVDAKTELKVTQNNDSFNNVDPSNSVFVDKLITPVLMVHSSMNMQFQPSFLMRDICFNAPIQEALKNMRIEKPMRIQTLTWVSILRGHSVFMVSPVGSGKTLGYLPAVSRLLSVGDAHIVDSVGPSCIIVCATAMSVSETERLARLFCGSKKVLALFTGMSDLELTTSVFNKSDLLICTPSILFRLLKSSDFGIDLRRLTTFVLDDCERLAKVYAAEIVYFQKKIRDMLRNRVPKEMRVQYIVASREWCDFMRPLAKSAPNAVVCISAFQECVLYSKANTSASFVTKENKDKAVLDFLKQIDTSKKTVIVCRKDEEVEHLEKALTNAKYVVVACNSTMDVQELYNLSLTLGNYHDSVSGLILVCCDGNVTHLNVTDAHNLIHYSLPNLFSMFCKRFSVLNENYPSMFKEDNEDVRIKILLDDSNVEQIPKILHFIKRCTSSVPEVLDEICNKVLAEKDVAKAKDLVPVCDGLLALGECPDYWNCRERHAMFKEYDEPLDWMPTSGEITFKILHYQNAVFYSARLLSNVVNGKETKYPQTFSMLSTKMSMYFATESNQKLHGTPKVGDICAVSVKQNFYERCQVVKILSHYQRGNPNEVLIRLIDEEKLQKSRDIYLYYLPDDFKFTQTNTVQVRLAGVQPKEKDITYPRLASDRLRAITNADDELYLKGHVALTIGNCIFVDALVTCKDLTFGNSVIRHDLKQELLNSFAKINPEHIPKLESLCKAAQLDIQEEEKVKVDAMKTKKDLPDIRWAHLEKDEICPTVFTYAIDPSTFFVRLVKFDQLMDRLIDDIQTLVQNPEPVTEFHKGDIFLAKLPDDGMYERARIDEVLDDGKVKCFFVDHGDWREVAISDLAPIPEKFITRLPFQAIECRLFGVLPPGKNWTDFSTIWLTNCLEDHDGNPKRFYVKRFTTETSQYTGGRKYGIAVIDTSSEEDVVINQAMVDLNMARENAEEMDMVKDMDYAKAITKTIDNESDDEEWEKIPKQKQQEQHAQVENVKPRQDALVENVKPRVPLEDLFPKKPIRSVPLVQSDEESEDPDKWDCSMTEDFMSVFKPAGTSNLPAIQGKDTDSEASISVINSPISQNRDDMQRIQPVKYASSQSSSEVSVSVINSVSKSKDSDAKLECASLNEQKSLADDVKVLDSDDLTSPEPSVMVISEEQATEIIKNDVKTHVNVHPTGRESSLEYGKIPKNDAESKSSDKTVTKLLSLQNDTKDLELRKPKVLWRQNKTKVHAKILIIVEHYKITIEERRLQFSAVANDTNYGFDFELYGVVDKKQCKHENKGQYILVTLTKILKKNWLSLTKDSGIKKWIVYDVDSLDVSSSEEETTESNMAANMIKIHADSDSDDDEFCDDLHFRYSK